MMQMANPMHRWPLISDQIGNRELGGVRQSTEAVTYAPEQPWNPYPANNGIPSDGSGISALLPSTGVLHYRLNCTRSTGFVQVCTLDLSELSRRHRTFPVQTSMTISGRCFRRTIHNSQNMQLILFLVL